MNDEIKQTKLGEQVNDRMTTVHNVVRILRLGGKNVMSEDDSTSGNERNADVEGECGKTATNSRAVCPSDEEGNLESWMRR